jgi:hypothetical protein
MPAEAGAVSRGAALLLFKGVSNPSSPRNIGGLYRSCRLRFRPRVDFLYQNRRTSPGVPVWCLARRTSPKTLHISLFIDTAYAIVDNVTSDTINLSYFNNLIAPK